MNGEKAKLVVFDLNETLIEENTWYELNMAMGLTHDEDTQFMKWYEEGIITYEEGQRMLEKIYISRGQGTREKMLSVMKYTYKPGAREVVEYLKEKGYTLVLLSGSIDLLVSKVANELGITRFGAHNKIQFDDQGMFKKIICRGDDADFKLEMLVKHCNDLHIGINEAVCIGDGFNDVKMFAECGHGVTFKGSRIEDKAWKIIESLEELKTIL